ncbi:MAG: GNAT family N-acetyltransferase [Chloroflexota bacterium]|nr:GNAT family N-acetyltransferase [Chloroflexota bacterium]
MLHFRPLTPDDYPLLLEWLQRPHVKEWWDDGDDTLDKVATHYGDEDDTVRFLLIETDAAGAEQPLGYFQYYLEPDGVVGIDQFLADAGRLGQGLGTQAVQLFCELVIAQRNPRRIILDPDPANGRAIRCYEKAGFRHYATVPTDEGGVAYMMQIERAPTAPTAG